jgi:hypothetical protein
MNILVAALERWHPDGRSEPASTVCWWPWAAVAFAVAVIAVGAVLFTPGT